MYKSTSLSHIVWDVAKNIIPTLTSQIKEIIDSYSQLDT